MKYFKRLMNLIKAFQRYWRHQKNDNINTDYCLMILGSRDIRQQLANIYNENNDVFQYLIEILTIKKIQNEKRNDPLTAIEFMVFLQTCNAEIYNEQQKLLDDKVPLEY